MKKLVKKEPTLYTLQAGMEAIQTDVHGLRSDIHDVLKAVDGLAVKVGSLDERVEKMDVRLGKVESRLGKVEKSLKQTATKDDLNEKTALVRGDFTQLARKSDAKLMRLAGALYDEGVLPEKELKVLYEMEPFAVLTLPKK